MRSHFAKLPLPVPPKLDSAVSTSPPPERIKRFKPELFPHSLQGRYDHDHAQDPCPSSNGRLSDDTTHGDPGRDVSKPKPRPEPVPEHASSSDALPEEDVALCLVMLSRNWWKARNAEAADDGGGDDVYNDVDDSDEEDETLCLTRSRSRGEYRCETCNKCFRSYQALGGHRAGHTNSNYAITKGANRRIFQCPYCYRVFDSGQALGGHKKVHHLHSSNTNSKNDDSVSVFTDKSPTDLLNLTALPEEEDGEVVSELELEPSPEPNGNEEMSRPIKRRISRLQ